MTLSQCATEPLAMPTGRSVGWRQLQVVSINKAKTRLVLQLVEVLQFTGWHAYTSCNGYCG